jgi:hypothetical protein
MVFMEDMDIRIMVMVAVTTDDLTAEHTDQDLDVLVPGLLGLFIP